MSKQYYTAQEAMDILGMKKGLFYYYVNERSIEKHLPPGRKRGAYFLASDIDELATSLRGFVKQYSEEKKETIFRVARPEDAEGMYQLGERIMRPGGGGDRQVQPCFVGKADHGLQLIRVCRVDGAGR